MTEQQQPEINRPLGWLEGNVPKFAPRIPMMVRDGQGLPWVDCGWEYMVCAPGESHTYARHGMLAIPVPRTQEDLMIIAHETRHIKRGANLTGSPTRILMQRMLEEIATEVEEMHDPVNPFDIRRARDGLRFDNRSVNARDRIENAAKFLQYTFSVGVTRNPDLVDYFKDICSVLDDEDIRVLETARDEIIKDWSLLRVEQMADWLTDYFDPTLPDPEPEEESEESKEARKRAEEEEAEHENAAKESKAKRPDRDQNTENKQQEVPWPELQTNVKLDIHNHTANRLAPAALGSTWRATDRGVVIRRPNMLPTGAIYTRRTEGGSILIDFSGSMSFNDRVIRDQISKMPRLWSAAYSTGGLSQVRLCILSREGKMGEWDTDSERRLHPRGNGADHVALQYMVNNGPGPYVWVSDGGTGPASGALCDELMRRHKIIRVMSLEHAVEYLKGKPVPGWTITNGAYYPELAEQVREYSHGTLRYWDVPHKMLHR